MSSKTECRYGTQCKFRNTPTGCRYLHPEMPLSQEDEFRKTFAHLVEKKETTTTTDDDSSIVVDSPPQIIRTPLSKIIKRQSRTLAEVDELRQEVKNLREKNRLLESTIEKLSTLLNKIRSYVDFATRMLDPPAAMRKLDFDDPDNGT